MNCGIDGQHYQTLIIWCCSISPTTTRTPSPRRRKSLKHLKSPKPKSQNGTLRQSAPAQIPDVLHDSGNQYSADGVTVVESGRAPGNGQYQVRRGNVQGIRSRLAHRLHHVHQDRPAPDATLHQHTIRTLMKILGLAHALAGRRRPQAAVGECPVALRGFDIHHGSQRSHLLIAFF